MKKKIFVLFFMVLSLFAFVAFEKPIQDIVEVPQLESIEYNAGQTLNDILLPEGWEWVSGQTNPTVNIDEYQATFGDKIYTIKLIITKATPDYIANDDIHIEFKENTILSSINLLEGWSWKNPTTIILEGLNEYSAIFTPIDTNNYITVERLLKVEALKPVVIPDLNDIVYNPNQTLEDIALPNGWEGVNKGITPTVNNQNYEAVFNQNTYSIKLTVTKAIPEYIANDDIHIEFKENTLLSSINLLEGWIWKNPTTIILEGLNEYTTIFTPTDTINYKAVEYKVIIEANKLPILEDIVYDPNKTLEDISLPSGWEWSFIRMDVQS